MQSYKLFHCVEIKLNYIKITSIATKCWPPYFSQTIQILKVVVQNYKFKLTELIDKIWIKLERRCITLF